METTELRRKLANEKKLKARKEPPKISKNEAVRALRNYQRYLGFAFLSSTAFGIYLLVTDLSLWKLAVSHAYGLVAICVIDICFAALNFLSIRKILIPSGLWAILTFVLQLGDIVTAPEYKMTMQYFASYLFGLWAFDALLLAQIAVVVIALSARRHARVLAVKRKITYFDMGLKNSRRDFLQIIGTITGLIALTGLLAALDVVLNPPSPNPGTGTISIGTLPTGAIANANNLKIGDPVYFNYPSQGYPSILLKKTDGSLIALSVLCTHVCCQCEYDSASREIYCPCHGSVFDQTGNVLNGPAPSPLPSIQLNIDGSGNIFPVKIVGNSPCLSS